MSFDRYFLGGSFLPFVEIAFSVNYAVLFRVASRKIIAWRVFFPFFSLFLELFCYYSCSVRFVRFTEYECEFLEICMLHISPVAVC